mmetsp:Transcript_22087/g.46500  ORF Transcript_22087/g.46500 Transcript_22087/m.46500 type:complete len:100 (-) Transcript_22087:592-891(-)
MALMIKSLTTIQLDDHDPNISDPHRLQPINHRPNFLNSSQWLPISKTNHSTLTIVTQSTHSRSSIVPLHDPKRSQQLLPRRNNLHNNNIIGNNNHNIRR